MDEFNNNLNSDNNIDNFNKEDNKAFDFDLSILNKVKPPQVELEKKEEDNKVDELPKIDLEPSTEISTEEEIPFVDQVDQTNEEQSLESEESKEISFEEDIPFVDQEEPEVDMEESEETSTEEDTPFVGETNPIDDIHPMELDQHVDETTEEDVPFTDQPSTMEEESKDNNGYNENPFINTNPYEESVENTNPYVDYDNMEEVIGTNTESQTEEPITEPTYEKEIQEENIDEETKVNNETKKIDNDFKDLEKEQKKKEKKETTKFIFLFLMFVVIAVIIAYLHYSSEERKPIKINDIDIKTKDKKEAKEEDDEEEEEPPVEEEFSKQVETELDKYLKEGNSNGLSSLLSSSYNDTSKLEDIHNTTNTKVSSWLESLITNDAKDYATFTNDVNNVRSKIDGLYNLKFSDISYIDEEKYTEFNNKLNKIDEDSNDYYVALELYNNKDYNNAYKSFESINENSSFYNKSTKNMDDIVNNILDLLKGDIKTISTNLDYVSEEEQQVKYKQIKGIIEKYAIAYPYVKLSNNEEYNSLLKKYTELIKE